VSHKCHWPSCDKEVPPRLWGCREHWFRLPLSIRRRIWVTYKSGQEVSKTPSRVYLMVARSAQKWIELAEKYGDKIATVEFQKLIKEKGWPDKPLEVKV